LALVNALALALELLQLAAAAADAGVSIANILNAGIAKVKQAQESGVDLTDDDLQSMLNTIKQASVDLNKDPA
jgi:ribonuclease PH